MSKLANSNKEQAYNLYQVVSQLKTSVPDENARENINMISKQLSQALQA